MSRMFLGFHVRHGEGLEACGGRRARQRGGQAVIGGSRMGGKRPISIPGMHRVRMGSTYPYGV